MRETPLHLATGAPTRRRRDALDAVSVFTLFLLSQSVSGVHPKMLRRYALAAGHITAAFLAVLVFKGLDYLWPAKLRQILMYLPFIRYCLPLAIVFFGSPS